MIPPQPPTPPFPPPPPQRWYLPTWPERLQLLRWRILYFFPALLIVAGAALLPMTFLCAWKLLVIVVAIPITAAINSAKRVIRLRIEPFCIHCGYDLTGLPDGHNCPECGIQFWHREIDDYRRDPHWYIQRHSQPQQLPPSGAAIDAGPRRTPPNRYAT
jgi:hypothetical protein